MKRTNARILTLSMAGALVLTACGSSEDSIAPTTTSAPAATTTSLTAAPTQPPTTTRAPATTTPTTTLAPEPEAPVLRLEVTGFPELAGGAHYEGWAIIEGTPVSTGKFNVVEDSIVDLDGQSVDRFEVEADLAAASTIVITIEPAGDTDTIPADTHFVAGDLGDASANLTIAHPAALGTDFADASGTFVLATPSTSTKSDELSGIWFLTLPGPEASLSLPTLPAGWTYEGWAVIDGVPLTSGTFRDVAAADDAAPFGGPGRMPPFPGEDFVTNAPDGVTLPTDLSGAAVVISVEPLPDDDPLPFVLKPLVGRADDPAQPEPVDYDLGLNIDDLPTAVATIG